MKQSKQQAIELAYLKLIDKVDFDNVKNYINENGWLNGNVTSNEVSNVYNRIYNSCEIGNNRIRPLSLKGIETNNNWISILSEKDLPREQIPCWFELKDDVQLGYYVPHKMSFAGCDEDYHYTDVIAYSEIKEPPKRVY